RRRHTRSKRDWSSDVCSSDLFSDRLFLGGWNGVSSASVLPAKVQSVGGNRSYDYTLWGVDNFLLRSNGYGFTSFLPSYVNESTRSEERRVGKECRSGGAPWTT